MLAHYEVISLLETHQGLPELLLELLLLTRRFHVAMSEGPNVATGGIVTLFRKAVFQEGSDWVFSSIDFVAGRALRTDWTS